jgi:hypothetical protein
VGEQLPLLLRTFHFTVIRVLIAALESFIGPSVDRLPERGLPVPHFSRLCYKPRLQYSIGAVRCLKVL